MRGYCARCDRGPTEVTMYAEYDGLLLCYYCRLCLPYMSLDKIAGMSQDSQQQKAEREELVNLIMEWK